MSEMKAAAGDIGLALPSWIALAFLALYVFLLSFVALLHGSLDFAWNQFVK